MFTVNEYSILALHPYNLNESVSEVNMTMLPNGWEVVAAKREPNYGFQGEVFRKDGAYVISFAGTDETVDWLTNAALGTGILSSIYGGQQIKEAARLVIEVLKEDPAAEITFTGHSLGGGLASMMAAMFDKSATTFASAPFASGLLNANFASIVNDLLRDELGFVPSSFASYFADPAGVSSERSEKISVYYAQGELLTLISYPDLVESVYWMPKGAVNLAEPLTGAVLPDSGLQVGSDFHVLSLSSLALEPGFWDGMPVLEQAVLRHDMRLHAALVLSPDFAAAASNERDLVSLLFDANLYYRERTDEGQDFLSKLINDQIHRGLENQVDSLLSMFGRDIQFLSSSKLREHDHEMHRALLSSAIEYYAYAGADEADGFFSSAGFGAVEFDLRAVALESDQQLGRARLLSAVNGIFAEMIPGVEAQERVAEVAKEFNTWVVSDGTNAMKYDGAGGVDERAVVGTYGGANHIRGGVGDDLIVGGKNDDHLFGNDGRDILIGGLGNDWLDGGAGADWMIGGQGNDTYIVDDEGDVVDEAEGGGNDTVYASISYRLPTHVENLHLTGQNAVHGYGNELSNEIHASAGISSVFGEGGDDVLYGGGSESRLYGGQGNDTFYVKRPSDVVVEYAGEGWDTIISSIDYVLPAHVEKLVLTGKAKFAQGNDQDNVILGSDAGCTIYGMGGDNVLKGGSGADRIYGGTGNDTIVASEGGDRIDGGGGMNAFDASAVKALFNVDLGSGTYSWSSFSWWNPLTWFNYTEGSGALQNVQVVRGSDFGSAFKGSVSDESFVGGSGDNTYFFGKGSGNDVIYEVAESEAKRGSVALVKVNSGVALSDLLFQRMGDDLRVEFLRDEGSLTVAGWYESGIRQAGFEVSGKSVTAAQIEGLAQVVTVDPGASVESLFKWAVLG